MVWTQPALDDVDGIVLFIARDSPHYAALTLSTFFDVADELAMFPHSGRIVPEVGRHDVRERIIGNYRLIYQVNEPVRVLAVIHASRDLGRLSLPI